MLPRCASSGCPLASAGNAGYIDRDTRGTRDSAIGTEQPRAPVSVVVDQDNASIPCSAPVQSVPVPSWESIRSVESWV
jgi:hypothetical protein